MALVTDLRYDVFISFRGADTRKKFTSHLKKSLEDAGYYTFYDDQEIGIGEPLKRELDDAIKSSRASVIVLSKHYASSSWCLDELVLILEQNKKFNRTVIPIFYDVEPTHVRKQESSFGEAMEKYKKRMEDAETAEKKDEWARKIQSWKTALTDVAGLKGWLNSMDGMDEELLEKIIKELSGKLGVPLNTPLPQLIGMEYYTESITSWLKDPSAAILTISGLGGIGKTSLANHVYQLHRYEYASSSFVGDIRRKCSEKHHGLYDVQKRLLKDITNLIQDDNVSGYTSKIGKVLARKEVLLVLDDVDSLDQLDALLGKEGLQDGSKIIITTKDTSLTERCELLKTKVQIQHFKCKLEPLDMDASLELLYYHAFRSNYPNEGYKEVSEKLANYCDGLPLALEVLGKILYKRDVGYWDATLEDLKKEPDSKIKSVLQISFDSLSSEYDKELFKHIACFFVGKDREFTETILNTRTGITHLVEKCLLSVKRDNKLAMHSLIQDMGRDLVRQESPKIIGKRSRLWCHEDSFKVLERNKGTDYILGLALDMRMLEDKTLLQSFVLKNESFSQMDNIELLQLNYVQLNDQCFQNFPEELRWLCMHGFPLKSIYINQPMENLVALDMSYSNIESLEIRSNIQPPTHRQKSVESSSKGRCLLGSLKILDLSFCEQLYSLGGFSELPALERLIVRKCISLIEVCESVEQCIKLVHIDMSCCYKLKAFPISLGKLKHVQTLLLDGCDLLVSTFMTSLPRSLETLSLINMKLSEESFPVEFNCLNKLEALYLDDNPIVSMPDCVRTLPRLQLLSMNNCLGLVSIEHPPRTLRELSIKCYNMPRKIKFDPEMSPLRLMGNKIQLLRSPLDVDGMVKIQPMADVEEKVLHTLGWTNSEFTIEGRLETQELQLHYEFGIFSTYYWGEGMPNWIRNTIKVPAMKFTVPSSPRKLRGLNFCCVEQPAFSDQPFFLPEITINNRSITQKHTWIYHHCTISAKMVKPSDGNREGENWCFSWLSHWMFGPNEMKPGDEITIHVEHLFPTYDDDVIKECGIDLVYDEDGKIEEEEDALGYYKSWNHIIGGDLSDLQLTTGEYFLEQTQFTRDPDDSSYSLSTGPRSYKVEKVLFKAFSQKSTSEILGSQAECSETRPAAMSPDGVPYMSISLQPDIGHQKQLSPDGYTVKQLNDAAGEAIAFANSSPEKKRTILSEKLYPIVKLLEAESATEVTEMLLELGPAEVLHLLGSPQELKAEVEQAMGILQSSPHIRSACVAFALSHANSGTEQKAILGRNLYPLVEELESESAPEVTTMILELEMTEILHLLESPEALKAKVAKAMDALQSSDHDLLLACVYFALINANSGTKQRTILRGYLLPLVREFEAESALVVTRMLVDQLELNQIFMVLASQEALQEKVAEAMEDLRSVNPSGDAIVTSALANASPTE